MDPGDADREALEDRVAELEQTVSKMLPDRRGVLKGLGAAAVGGAAVSGATGGASGQSAAGQVGTEEAPVDVEGARGNFDSVSTDREYTRSRPVETIIWTNGTDTYADGPTGPLADGPDAATVIQTAFDNPPIEKTRFSIGQGEFLLDNGIALTNECSIIGQGSGGSGTPLPTYLKAGSGVDATALLEIGDSDTKRIGNLIRDLAIDPGNAASGTTGLHIRASQARVIDVKVINSPGDGIRVDSPNHTIHETRMRGVRVQTPDQKGVVVVESDSHIYDLVVSGATTGLEISRGGNTANLVHVYDSTGDAVVVSGNRNILSDLRLYDNDATGIQISGDYNYVNGYFGRNGQGGGYEDHVNISGDHNLVVGTFEGTWNGNKGEQYGVSVINGTENLIIGQFSGNWRSSAVYDDATRTIINGNSTNDGDPNESGQWNGHAQTAHTLGATVWDTSTSPETPYRGTPSGSWVQE